MKRNFINPLDFIGISSLRPNKKINKKDLLTRREVKGLKEVIRTW